jgi:hypothetical protein
MDRAKGWQAVVGVVAALCILTIGVKLTWPVGLFAGLASTGWFFTIKPKTTIESAVHEVLGPIALGLLLLSALLLLFNLTSAPDGVVGVAERALVRLDNDVSSWSRFLPGAFAGSMVFLMAAVYMRPRLRLIAVSSINKFLTKVPAVLAAATSFTFFSNVAVVQPRAPAVYHKIEAIYRNSKKEERKSVARFLAAKAVDQALINQDPSDRYYFRLLLDSIVAIPTMDLASKQELAGYMAEHLNNAEPRHVTAGTPSIEESPLPHRSALNLLDGQLAVERTAARLADEEGKATKELASEALGLGADSIKKIGWSFVDGLIGQQADVVEQLVRPFIDKIFDKSFEKDTDPIVTKLSEAVRRLFDHPEGGPAEPEITAKGDTHAAIELMNARNLALAHYWTHKAGEALRARTSAADAGDMVKARTELANAELASDQATKAATLATTASESLKAAPNEARAAAIAAGGAGTDPIATETAEAVKMAKSVAQDFDKAAKDKAAVSLTEAVRTVVKAAPSNAKAAWKSLLRVISKSKAIPK